MATSFSIFDLDGWRILQRTWEETRGRWRLGRFFATVALALPGIAYAVLNPNDFFWGRFSIDASIRAAHHPAEEPFPGHVEVSEDGLYFYPTTAKPNKRALVVGDSTSYWITYPGWIQRRSVGVGDPWAVYTAARGGAKLYDIEDTLAYILANNHREFDLILAKPGAGIMWDLVYDPENAYQHPPIGSGYSLPHSGAPADATRTSFFHHFLSTYRRRCADLDNWRRNRRMQELLRYNLTQLGVLFSSEIPREATEDIARFETEYEEGLLGLIEIARLFDKPIAFLTTHRRPHRPDEPGFHDPNSRLAAYKGKYLLAGFQHRVTDLTNRTLRSVCQREGVPLVDSAAYLNSLPQEELFLDAFHLQYRYEAWHGKFIYDQLKQLGF
jgi:hypothetical protein